MSAVFIDGVMQKSKGARLLHNLTKRDRGG